jgi:hypothetical protein
MIPMGAEPRYLFVLFLTPRIEDVIEHINICSSELDIFANQI